MRIDSSMIQMTTMPGRPTTASSAGAEISARNDSAGNTNYYNSEWDVYLSDQTPISLRHHLSNQTPISPRGEQSSTASATDANNMPLLTVDGLINAFGTDNPTYDLNVDGVVDILDFQHLLIHGGIAPHSGADITHQGFESTLGTSNAAYDLDGDGTVTSNDYMQWLVGHGAETHETSAPAASTPQASAIDQPSAVDWALAHRNSVGQAAKSGSLLGQQAMQIYEQLWNNFGNMPPRQLLSGA